MRTFLSGLILLCVGAGIGVLLIAWSSARYPSAPKVVVPDSPAGLAAGPAAPPASTPVVPQQPDSPPAGAPIGPRVSGAQVITVVGTPPVPPTPSAEVANRPKFQPNGLPVGVVKNPYDPEVYKRLPGVRPPIINYDGRDMKAEALSMMQTPREPVPMPGLTAQQQSPGAPAQPRPFPKTLEEANATLNGPAPGQQ